MRRLASWSIGVLCCAPALAQSSASYELEEHMLNAGGNPSHGVVLAAPSFRLSLDAVGDPIASLGGAGSSASYRLEGGFATAFRPPGEVLGLRFPTHTTFTWSPERAAASYAVYRSTLDQRALSTGDCFAPQVIGEAAADTDQPPVGVGYFYLVTGRNRLGEEGTKGFRSDGAERANPNPCP
jgi:hypothetical protein